MYATCIFCHTALGANEVIEQFPIGRQLAFDAARGRLWAVCVKCGRWNLTPIEERWEAIESCERTFRATRLRASTGNIGLARARDGTHLIRIGDPLRQEFAAWRYARHFARRFRRQLLVSGGIAFASVFAGKILLPAAIVAAGGGPMVQAAVGWARGMRLRRRIVALAVADDGLPLIVRGADVSRIALSANDDGSSRLEVAQSHAMRVVRGRPVLDLLALVAPRLNHAGAYGRTVTRAVDRLGEYGHPSALVDRIARDGHTDGGSRLPGWVMGRGFATLPAHALGRLSQIDSLALEMAAHEENERRAMEGELAHLEAQWRAAEEIAAIADDLLIPPGVRDDLDRLKSR